MFFARLTHPATAPPPAGGGARRGDGLVHRHHARKGESVVEDLLDAHCAWCQRTPAEECDVCFAVMLCRICMRKHKEEDHEPSR